MPKMKARASCVDVGERERENFGKPKYICFETPLFMPTQQFSRSGAAAAAAAAAVGLVETKQHGIIFSTAAAALQLLGSHFDSRHLPGVPHSPAPQQNRHNIAHFSCSQKPGRSP